MSSLPERLIKKIELLFLTMAWSLDQEKWPKHAKTALNLIFKTFFAVVKVFFYDGRIEISERKQKFTIENGLTVFKIFPPFKIICMRLNHCEKTFLVL